MRFKLLLLSIMSVCVFHQALSANDECWSSCNSSHSFFVPRAITPNNVLQLSLHNYHWYHEQKERPSWQGRFYATPFVQQSTKPNDITRHFFRNNQCSLTFREINENTDDICSLWFGLQADLDTDFNAVLRMKPKRKAFGAYIDTMVAKYWHNCAAWINCSFAIVKAEHTLRLQEDRKAVPGPLNDFELGTIAQPSTLLQALNNSQWCYGKFNNCKQSRSGVDDIQIKVGFDWFYSVARSNHLTPYMVATIGTGKADRSAYIFEPRVGSNHNSIGFGVDSDWTFLQHGDHCLTWLGDIKYRYVMSADGCRSFDVCANGDWSRYLLVVKSDQRLDTKPGINIFTQRAKITPRSTIDMWTALHWQWRCVDVEIGYDFWWRQKEKVRLKSSFPSSYGIFDLAGAAGMPQSASQANISQSAIGANAAVSDASFIALKQTDLNLDSAAHPTALSSTIYLAADVSSCVLDHALLVGGGVSYEIAHRITALQQWAVWAKVGLIF